mgnify:CR=1 FL=1
MSLAKLPLRIATVLALRGRTWVADRVFDSTITPIETKIDADKGLPFIVVYTDASHGSDEIGRDLTAFRPDVDLVFHVAVATEFRGTESGTEVVLARSDPGFEAQLDVIEAQIARALQRDPGDWADLWRAFVLHHGELRSRRGASARKGSRFAAREIVLPVQLAADPEGTGDEYPWGTAIERFAAETDLADLAVVLRSFCDDGVALPDWAKLYRTLGFDAARARVLGFVTADGEEVVFP